MRDYKEVLTFLYAQLPVFHRDGKKALKPGLQNIQRLCADFGNPEKAFPSLHIAGTNGKGSCSHLMASILKAHGYKVGLYTSPHLINFGERIQVDGKLLPESWLIQFVEQHQEKMKLEPASFFEWTVLMAFQYFKEQAVDIAVIETGLGGRLDSTNILKPLACLITNIGFDHMDVLGDCLEDIAFEKAGIIKPGIPICIGEYLQETQSVFKEKANQCQSPIVFAQDTYEAGPLQQWGDHCSIELQDKQGDKVELSSSLMGNYQANNLRSIWAWCRQLQDLKILPLNNASIQQGIRDLQLHFPLKGRWQILGKEPLIVADTGHNELGLQQLVLQFSSQKARNKWVILGMVSDKDVRKSLALLPKNWHYCFTQAQLNPRALKAELLKEHAAALSLDGFVCPEVNQAIAQVRERSTQEDAILICGSTYLIAEIQSL